MMASKCAASGCNYPEGDCAGICTLGMTIPKAVAAVSAKLEARHKGKVIMEIWPNGQGLEIVFNDNSTLLISGPYVFKEAPEPNTGEVK